MDTEVEERGKVLKRRVQAALSSGIEKSDVDAVLNRIIMRNEEQEQVIS